MIDLNGANFDAGSYNDANVLYIPDDANPSNSTSVELTIISAQNVVINLGGNDDHAAVSITNTVSTLANLTVNGQAGDDTVSVMVTPSTITTSVDTGVGANNVVEIGFNGAANFGTGNLAGVRGSCPSPPRAVRPPSMSMTAPTLFEKLDAEQRSDRRFAGRLRPDQLHRRRPERGELRGGRNPDNINITSTFTGATRR